MLCKAGKSKLFSLIFRNKQSIPVRLGGGGSRYPHPKKNQRIKVQDHLIWINFIGKDDGIIRRAAGLPGEPLLSVMTKHSIPDIYPECGGMDQNFPPYQIPSDHYGAGPDCCGCQILIPQKWNNKIYKSQRQTRCLERKAFLLTQTSRLACCIAITPEMNEMVVGGCLTAEHETDFS